MKADDLVIEGMEAHKKGEIDLAETKYKEALKRNCKDKRAFANLAAILRSKGESLEAAKVANEGLKQCGQNSPILLNTLGNALKDLGRLVEAINTYRRAIKHAPDYMDPKYSLISSLEDAGYVNLANLCTKSMVRHYGMRDETLITRLIAKEVDQACKENRGVSKNVEVVLSHLDEKKIEKKGLPEHWFHMSQLCLSKDKNEEAIEFHKRGIKALEKTYISNSDHNIREKILKLRTISSWNFGCGLLRNGNFSMGWKLYEHGLRAPAEGKQRWQRSLYKPFSSSKIKPWKGENLSGKRILLLGEQGIGDTMMFITMLPKLISEGAEITVLVPHRLEKIYKRSLTKCDVISDTTFRNTQIDPAHFDYQSPLGSVPQYRFTNVDEFNKINFSLRSDVDKTLKLREKYQEGKRHRKILGISWQGGGTKDRIESKSVNIEKLIKLL